MRRWTSLLLLCTSLCACQVNDAAATTESSSSSGESTAASSETAAQSTQSFTETQRTTDGAVIKIPPRHKITVAHMPINAPILLRVPAIALVREWIAAGALP